MATQTTNLHLTKPDGSEKVNIATINTNMDTIDTYAGTNNASIINLAEDIGVVVNGNKTKSGVTAAVGQYVILKNSTISNRVDGLYTAAKAIPANTAIDASYLTAVSGGGLNALNAKIDTKLLLNQVTSFQVIEDTGHNLLILRGNYEGTGNYLQLINNANTKQIQIAKSVNGTETTLATFAEVSSLLSPTNVSANVTIASGGYVKIGTIVIVNVHINVDEAVTGNDTICVFPAPRLGNQAAIPMVPSSSGISDGKVMYIRENGEARFFQGEASGTSYNISGAYIARS